MKLKEILAAVFTLLVACTTGYSAEPVPVPDVKLAVPALWTPEANVLPGRPEKDSLPSLVGATAAVSADQCTLLVWSAVSGDNAPLKDSAVSKDKKILKESSAEETITGKSTSALKDAELSPEAAIEAAMAENQQKLESSVVPEKQETPLPESAKPFASSSPSPFVRRAPVSVIDKTEIDKYHTLDAWALVQKVLAQNKMGAKISVDGAVLGNSLTDSAAVTKYLQSIPTVSVQKVEVTSSVGRTEAKSTFAGASNVTSLNLVTTIAASDKAALKSIVGTSTNGAFTVGAETTRKNVLGGELTAKFAHSDYGLWGTTAQPWRTGTVKDTLTGVFSRGTWKLTSEVGTYNTSSLTALYTQGGASWENAHWAAALANADLRKELNTGGTVIVDSVSVSLARKFQVWMLNSKWGLKYEWVRNSAADIDENVRMSPFIDVSIPIGNFELDWNLTYNDWARNSSSYSDGLEQTVTLKLKKPIG